MTYKQFGFVSGRVTTIATTLAHDVIEYCTRRGSAVYAFSSDAEAAFDGIRHRVMFKKTMGIVQDKYRRILVDWHSMLPIRIRWNGGPSPPTKISKGTRQRDCHHRLYSIYPIKK